MGGLFSSPGLVFSIVQLAAAQPGNSASAGAGEPSNTQELGAVMVARGAKGWSGCLQLCGLRSNSYKHLSRGAALPLGSC